MMQSLVPALYPILKDSYALSFGQIGLITLAFQFTASMLQPVVGIMTAMGVALLFTMWIGLYPEPFINMARSAFGL